MMIFLCTFLSSLIFAANPNIRLFDSSGIVTLKDTQGNEVSFPSGIRATQTSDGLVIFNDSSSRYELYQSMSNNSKNEVPKKFHTNRCFNDPSMIDNFFIEAKEAISQITKSHNSGCERIFNSLKDYPKAAKAYENCDENFKNSSPQFYELLTQTKAKLSLLETNKNRDKLLKSKLVKYNKEIHNHKNNVEKIQTFADLLKSSFDPVKDSQSFSSQTLYIPISLDWINSNPKIKAWYDKNWAPKGVMTPFKGGSGEGITKFASSQLYEDTKSKLIKLRDYAHSLYLENLMRGEKKSACPGVDDNTVSIQKTAEYKWLQTLSEESLKNNKRFIFIQDQTFRAANSQWREYIPTDQSISCFKPDPVFSTLIHEANVNSDSFKFFPDDTHGTDGNESVKELLLIQDDNLRRFKSLVSREHYLQLIYLSTILR